MAAKQPRKRGRPPETTAGRLRRAILVGAAIGVYFGYFFRPVREEANLLIVLTLSPLAAFAATLVLAWQIRRQEGPKLRRLLRYALRMWVTFALFLLMLEGRHIAYDLGVSLEGWDIAEELRGRLATIAFTTVAGAVLGLWYAFSAGKEGA